MRDADSEDFNEISTWVQSPGAHLMDMRRKFLLVRLVTDPEVKEGCALADGRQKTLAKQNVARRMPSEVDSECRYPPQVPTAVRESEVEGDRALGPIYASESQPTGPTGKLDYSMIEITFSLSEESTWVGRDRATRDVLREKVVEVRQDLLPVAHMPDLERPVPQEIALQFDQLPLARSRQREFGFGSQLHYW